MTNRQQRVLAMLRQVCHDGWPATVRELQVALGYGSPTSVHDTLHELQQLGLAEFHPRNASGGWMPVEREPLG